MLTEERGIGIQRTQRHGPTFVVFGRLISSSGSAAGFAGEKHSGAGGGGGGCAYVGRSTSSRSWAKASMRCSLAFSTSAIRSARRGFLLRSASLMATPSDLGRSSVVASSSARTCRLTCRATYFGYECC